MPTSESQKKATMKWREANKEFYHETHRIALSDYYQKNREKILEQRRVSYLKKKEAKLQEKVLQI